MGDVPGSGTNILLATINRQLGRNMKNCNILVIMISLLCLSLYSIEASTVRRR